MSRQEPNPLDQPTYRDRLYGSYVSGNKRFNVSPANNHSIQKANLENLIHSFGPWVESAAKSAPVLDVGCGPGNMMRFYRAMGFQNIRGIDTSAEQIAIAQAEFPQAAIADAFEFLSHQKNETYGVISAIDLLEHLTREEAFRFLDLIREALIPGGILLLQLPNGDSPFCGAMAYGDATHEQMYTKVSLRHLLIATGFEPLQFREHGPLPHGFKSSARFLLWNIARLGIRLLHTIETGGPSTGIYTRVMRACARKSLK